MIRTIDNKFKSDFDNINEIHTYTNILELDKSVSTIKSYLSSIDKLFHFVKVESLENIKNITYDNCCQFQMQLKADGLKESSINSTMRPIKAFFYWMVDRKYIEENPIKGIKELKEPDIERPYMTRDEQIKFLQACGNLEDKFMFLLLLGTGIRREELVKIKLNDIVDRKIKINGKGKKKRAVSMSDSVFEAYNAYLLYRSLFITEMNKDINYLFISPIKKDKYDGRVILYKFKAICLKAGFSPERIKSLHLHSTRHSFVANNPNVDIKILQKILGHANIQTTEKIYLHIFEEDVDDAMINQKSIL
jgi:integrase/recombinase XerD